MCVNPGVKNLVNKALTVPDLSKVKTLVIRENPPTQKSIAKSVAPIIKIINQDLQVKKAKEHNIR